VEALAGNQEEHEQGRRQDDAAGNAGSEEVEPGAHRYLRWAARDSPPEPAPWSWPSWPFPWPWPLPESPFLDSVAGSTVSSRSDCTKRPASIARWSQSRSLRMYVTSVSRSTWAIAMRSIIGSARLEWASSNS